MGKRTKEYPEKLITAFLTEVKAIDVQRSAGISRTKYYALKRDPDFMQAVTDRRTEIIQAAVYQMERNLAKNIGILQAIIDDTETAPQVRVNAINLYMSQLDRWKMQTEILERLQRLENDVL